MGTGCIKFEVATYQQLKPKRIGNRDMDYVVNPIMIMWRIIFQKLINVIFCIHLN